MITSGSDQCRHEYIRMPGSRQRWILKQLLRTTRKSIGYQIVLVREGRSTWALSFSSELHFTGWLLCLVLETLPTLSASIGDVSKSGLQCTLSSSGKETPPNALLKTEQEGSIRHSRILVNTLGDFEVAVLMTQWDCQNGTKRYAPREKIGNAWPAYSLAKSWFMDEESFKTAGIYAFTKPSNDLQWLCNVP